MGDGDPEKWHKLFHLNVLAVMELTREVVPYLKQSSNGALVTLSSISGQKAMKGLSAYCASKHAVRGFTLSCFEDLREDGIKVSTICPGMVNTGLPPDEGTDRSLMIQPEDIAHTVDFVLNFPSTACPTEITIRPQRSPTREG